MDIPKEIKNVIKKLEKAGHEAYVVGGCVRDLLLNKKPKDWDVTTSAKPEEVQKVFNKTLYQNEFLTVTVQITSKEKNLKQVEVTTFRSETKYTDKRHPDKVKFAQTIEQDLSRRDFTVNAIALTVKTKSFTIIDPFNGQKDLKNKTIKAVGNPEKRFSEDALRMLRAVRFTVVLGEDWAVDETKASSPPCDHLQRSWVVDEAKASSPPCDRLQRSWVIEEKTIEAIKKNANQLQAISGERIRDELMKIIMSKRAAQGIETLRKTGLLKYIIPELEQGYGVSQNKHHIYDCYEHNLKSFDYAVKKNFNKYVRIAALLHDIAKPHCKRGQGSDATFYNHEIVSAKMAFQILNRLKFSKKDIEKIVKLVRYHLFYYNVGEVSESSVRRLVRQVGLENMEDLLQVRMADRIGSGVPKAEPYKLRHLKYVIEKVSRDPISVKMLKVNGKDVMGILKIKPGPLIGQILDVLLAYVLLEPSKNKKEFLEKEIKKLGKLKEKELMRLTEKSQQEREKIEIKKDKMTKSKYWIT